MTGTAATEAGSGNAGDRAETSEPGVELALETVGNEAVLAQAFAATGRGGLTVTAGLPHPDSELRIPALAITAEERSIKGSYLGSCVPSRDIPRFIQMYRDGRLPVDRGTIFSCVGIH